MNEKWYTIIKQGVLNNIYEIIDAHLRKETIRNQFHIYRLYNDFIFKTQINLIRFTEEFKASEISYVTTFDTTCTPNLTQSVYTVP